MGTIGVDGSIAGLEDSVRELREGMGEILKRLDLPLRVLTPLQEGNAGSNSVDRGKQHEGTSAPTASTEGRVEYLTRKL